MQRLYSRDGVGVRLHAVAIDPISLVSFDTLGECSAIRLTRCTNKIAGSTRLPGAHYI